MSLVSDRWLTHFKIRCVKEKRSVDIVSVIEVGEFKQLVTDNIVSFDEIYYMYATKFLQLFKNSTLVVENEMVMPSLKKKQAKIDYLLSC